MKTKKVSTQKTNASKGLKRKKKEIIFSLPNIHIGGGKR